MGYWLGNKGYKLFDYVTNKFIFSRDVVFNEQVYPFGNEGQRKYEENVEAVPLPIIPSRNGRRKHPT